MGLTTSRAPFIENAKNQGSLFICQPYELYSEENQLAWRSLFALLLPRWKKFACAKFLEGIERLAISPDHIPHLEGVNAFLAPLTGFQAKAVSGYVPTYQFFDCLKNRIFPTTITIRQSDMLNYLPEPDIFHDISGHVPMHTDKTFAESLVRFGKLANLAKERHQAVKDKNERIAKIRSNIQALARFFWFTIEFGLIAQKDRLCVYGSGILSSATEIEHAIVSSAVLRAPFQLEWVINQSYEIDRLQPLLFVIDSFEHLYDEVDRLERWLNNGLLDNVAPGKPEVLESDLEAFL